MQAEGKLAPGAPRKYPSAFAAYGIIARWVGRVQQLCNKGSLQTFCGREGPSAGGEREREPGAETGRIAAEMPGCDAFAAVASKRRTLLACGDRSLVLCALGSAAAGRRVWRRCGRAWRLTWCAWPAWPTRPALPSLPLQPPALSPTAPPAATLMHRRPANFAAGTLSELIGACMHASLHHGTHAEPRRALHATACRRATPSSTPRSWPLTTRLSRRCCTRVGGSLPAEGVV